MRQIWRESTLRCDPMHVGGVADAWDTSPGDTMGHGGDRRCDYTLNTGWQAGPNVKTVDGKGIGLRP